MTERMTARQLAEALLARRDNDVAVSIGTSLVPVVGVRYAPALDRCVITLDPEETDDAVWSASGQAALGAAMHSVWLHGDWFWLTRQMSTEEREAAAAAVHHHHDSLDGELALDDRALRWWAPEYRYNVHGVDTNRLAPRAQVLIDAPKLGRHRAEVQKRGSTSLVVAYGPALLRPTIHIDHVVQVFSSPVDRVLARLDAHATDDNRES